MMELLQWKAVTGLSDKRFEKLLKIVKKMLPKDNELPASTYKAKKIICPLGLEVQKIHAFPNDCILYRGEEYENLNACPVCSAFRDKIKRDDPGDVEGERQGDVVCSYNTMVEMFFQKQRACQVVVVAQGRP
jgi:hypothetical protein